MVLRKVTFQGERGALTHSHDSERSSLCSQRGSLDGRRSARSLSCTPRVALPRFLIAFASRCSRFCCCCCCETQTRTLSGPPSTRAAIPMLNGRRRGRFALLFRSAHSDSPCSFALLPRFRSAKIALPAPVFALPRSRATAHVALPPSRATTVIALLGGSAFRWVGVSRWVGTSDLPIEWSMTIKRESFSQPPRGTSGYQHSRAR
jgi:hypothetical protein